MTDAEIQFEAVRRVTRMTGLNAEQRKAEIARVEAELRAEAEAQAIATAQGRASAEAEAERARISAVFKAGTDMARPRQALRLALAGPLDAAAARVVLCTFPPDPSASGEALALPAAATFGSAAAQAERRRISAILGHVEAEGRFHTAAAIALETGLDLGSAMAVLAGAPRQAARESRPSLAERSAAAGDFGPDGGADAFTTKADRSRNVWKKAIAESNRAAGFTPSAGQGEVDEATRMAALRAQLDASMTQAAENAARIMGGAWGRIE